VPHSVSQENRRFDEEETMMRKFVRTAPFLIQGFVAALIASGCGVDLSRVTLGGHEARTSGARDERAVRPSAPSTGDDDSAEIVELAARYLRPSDEPRASAREPVLEDGKATRAEGEKPRVRPLPLDGTWVPSGWMGDAEDPQGPLLRKVSRERPYSPPTCEEWLYEPAKRGSQGWVAVAYQFPANNWGDTPGKNLGQRGFTRLTFRARGELGGEQLLVKAGGHTRPGCSYPATFESDIVVVTLQKDWVEYSIPLEGLSLANTTCAFAFILRADECIDGKTRFYIDDPAFAGPPER
jgi:hypothetical protein